MRSRCQACSPAAGWLNSSSTHATHAAHAARTSARVARRRSACRRSEGHWDADRRARPAAVGRRGRGRRRGGGRRGSRRRVRRHRRRRAAARRTRRGTPGRSPGRSVWAASRRRKWRPASTPRRSPATPAGGVEPARLALDEHLQRHGRGVEARCVELGVGRDRAEDEPRRAGDVAAPAGDDRRAAVLGLELAHLPLAGEQPQRVGGAGGEAGRDVVAGRRRLDAGPAGDRRHPCSLRPRARRAARWDRWTRRRRRR